MYGYLLFLLFISAVYSYKILVFSPTISPSHMISIGRIADELAKAGHDVVLFEPDIQKIADKINSAKVARRWIVPNMSNAYVDVKKDIFFDLFEEKGLWYHYTSLLVFHDSFNLLCGELFKNETLMQQLRDEKFDAYFGEQINLCGFGIAHALGIKSYFWVSSCMIFESMAWQLGLPSYSSYISAGGMDMDLHPSYFTRAKNLLYTTFFQYMTHLIDWRTTQVFRDYYGNDFPYLGELAGNSDIVFVSTDEFVETPRPIMPNQINIGGLGIGDEDVSLNEKFANEMEKGEKGVVLFSLGSVVNTSHFPPCVMENLAAVAKKFPEYHFILRVDAHDHQAKAIAKDFPNVNVFDWLPQPGLLRHPRLRTFITHAGYNSVMEAARAGVPLITIPFIFDQQKNSRAVEQNGWGIDIHRTALRDDPQRIIGALNDVLSKDQYKKAALRIQQLIRTKPFSASERLVKTTEFVLDNGGIKELLSEARNLSTIRIYNLDIIIPFVVLVIVFVYCSVRFIKRVCCSAKSGLKLKKN